MAKTLMWMNSSPWIHKVHSSRTQILLSLCSPLRSWDSSSRRRRFHEQKFILLIAAMRMQSKESWFGRWTRSRCRRAIAGGFISHSRIIQSYIWMKNHVRCGEASGLLVASHGSVRTDGVQTPIPHLPPTKATQCGIYLKIPCSLLRPLI
jgi:hypothetical protein